MSKLKLINEKEKMLMTEDNSPYDIWKKYKYLTRKHNKIKWFKEIANVKKIEEDINNETID